MSHPQLLRQGTNELSSKTPEEVLEEALDLLYRNLKSKGSYEASRTHCNSNQRDLMPLWCWWSSWMLPEHLESFQKGGQNKSIKWVHSVVLIQGISESVGS